jgi:hypothetical protein
LRLGFILGCYHPRSLALAAVAASASFVHVWAIETHRVRTSSWSQNPRPRGSTEMAINYRSHFAYRIDMWDADGENIIEHLAGVEDLQFAKATYRAACKRWPGTPITLSEGMHVIEDNRRKRLV